MSPVMILIAVLLPAPFAPSSPNISPDSTENVAPSRAAIARERIPLPYYFFRFFTVMASDIFIAKTGKLARGVRLLL